MKLSGDCHEQKTKFLFIIPELKGNLAGIDLSHEAAVGKIAEEEVEYLMARGLTRSEAIATIVRGFLRVDIEGLPPMLSAELQRAIEASEVIASRPTSIHPPIPLIWIRYALLPDNHIVWGITSEYEFYVMDDNGRTVRKIRRKHTPVPLSAEYISEIKQSAPPGASKERYAERVAKRLSPHFPAFDFIFTDEAGIFFVKTFETEKETGRYLIDIFDTQGRFLARTPLKVGHVITGEWPNLYMIKKNHLYAPEHDENGFPVIKRYKIIWNIESLTP